MGTRGLYGFYFQGKYYLFYNQYDSYPSCLGNNILTELKTAIANNDLATWKTKIMGFKLIKPSDIPTETDIKNLEKYTNLFVSKQSTNDWYCLLRETQGKLLSVLDAGYCEIKYNSPETNIIIEFSYVIDLDENKFIVRYNEMDDGDVEMTLGVTVYGFDELPNEL